MSKAHTDRPWSATNVVTHERTPHEPLIPRFTFARLPYILPERMPIHAATPPDGHAVLTFQDPYVFAEWEIAMQSLINAKTERLLVDRRHAKAPSREFVERMTMFLLWHADQVEGWRTAVVTGDDAGYATARMVQMMTEARRLPARVQVFRTYEEAERWLTTEE